MHFGNGIDGVGNPAPVHLDIGEVKTGIAFQRRLEHSPPIGSTGEVIVVLVGWPGTGHKHYLVQLKFFQGVLGQDEVPQVNRVKRPS